jgi:two-component system, NtrC family, nitrogen regulation sensor histidine kinase NtrY
MAWTMKTINIDRRRLLEVLSFIGIVVLIVGITRLETRLYGLSESLAKDHTLLASIFYYAIINLNVFLVILLSVLVVRNIAKLLVDRKRGVFGSKLRTKLVAVLLVFSVVPTALVFYVSTRFITKSFDEWFGNRVKATTQQTRDAGAQIYSQNQRRLEAIARLAASRVRLPGESLPQFLPAVVTDFGGIEIDYGVQSLKVYDSSGFLVNRDSLLVGHRIESPFTSDAVSDLITKFSFHLDMMSASAVTVEEGRDVVRAAVPVRFSDGKLAAIVVVEERLDAPVLANLQTILDGLATLKPGAQLVRVSYLILVTVITLLIIFAAIWLGFYVARGITGPLQLLAEATKEVALGNYNVKLSGHTEDETGQLTSAFNLMTRDLARQRQEVEVARLGLEKSNQEIDRRRRYMEVVFKNIASGVIAVDAKGMVNAFNNAAVTMLNLGDNNLLGKDIRDILGQALYAVMIPDVDLMAGPVDREIDLREFGVEATIYVAATTIKSEAGEFQGMVLLIDDATDRIRMQRATAWREVARRIAHEIKNPITPIRLSAERMLRRFVSRFDGDDRRVFESCVESILTQVETLRSLVNEFSKFARLPTTDAKPSDLNAIIKTAVEVFKQGYVSISFIESYDRVPTLSLDPDQFNRVIVNLVSNAVDAVNQSSRAGVISLITRYDESLEAAIIEISDNGDGISENIKPRIFEPYFSTKQTGTGLGLAMVNQIVNDHGGYVRLSRSDANGTSFRIEIPVVAKVKL